MRVPGADESTKEFDDSVIEADEYRCRIVGWKEYTQPPGQFNKTEEERVLFRLQPLHQIDDPDADVVDRESGEPVEESFTVPFFYDPKRTGVWQGKVAKSRKFLAAALGVPIDDPIEFDGYDDLVDKEVIASVIVGKNKEGNKVNRIDSVRPVKKGKKAAPKPEPTAEELTGVFSEEEVAGVAEEETEY